MVGTAGISCLLALVNGALADLWLTRRAGAKPGIGALLILCLALLNGMVGALVLAGSDEFLKAGRGSVAGRKGSLRVAIVQPSVEGEGKWSGQHFDEILKTHLDLSEQALSSNPDLLIWPEGALGPAPGRAFEIVPLSVRKAAREMKVTILMGTVHRDAIRGTSHNSATIVSTTGGLTGRYDKTRLLPFAESVPRGLEFMAGPRVREYGYTPAARPPILRWMPDLGGSERPVGLGPFICFEALFPETIRQLPMLGANMLVHLSDEYWYRDPNASGQSVCLDTMRAVENRRSVARASNAGPSCFIDPWGRIAAMLKDETGRTCFIRGWVAAVVPLTDKKTVYSRLGDPVTPAGWMLLAILLIARRTGRYTRCSGRTCSSQS